MTKGKISD